MAMNLEADKRYIKVLLSVIVPIFNAQNTIEKCISSILEQTFTDFELILVNDGSEDDSYRICSGFMQSDHRVVLLEKENGGASSARRYGLERARGEYISFIDSDDWIEVNHFSGLMTEIVKTRADICVGGYVRNSNNGEVKVFSSRESMLLTRYDALREMFMYNLYGWEMCDKVYHYSIVSSVTVPNNIKHGEDLLFNWYAFNRANSVAYIPQPTYHYRDVESSITHKGVCNEDNLISSSFAMILKDKDDLTADIEYCVKMTMNAFLSTNLKVAMKSDFPNKKDYIKHGQCEVRKNILNIIMDGRATLRQKMGAVFFCMPYIFCVVLLKAWYLISTKHMKI